MYTVQTDEYPGIVNLIYILIKFPLFQVYMEQQEIYPWKRSRFHQKAVSLDP